MQGLNGHVGISTSEDDVDRVPLKISAQVISVAQDYFQHTHSPKINSMLQMAVNKVLLSE